MKAGLRMSVLTLIRKRYAREHNGSVVRVLAEQLGKNETQIHAVIKSLEHNGHIKQAGKVKIESTGRKVAVYFPIDASVHECIGTYQDSRGLTVRKFPAVYAHGYCLGNRDSILA